MSFLVPPDADDCRHGQPGGDDTPGQRMPRMILAQGLGEELLCKGGRPHATGLTSGGEEQVEAEWMHG